MASDASGRDTEIFRYSSLMPLTFILIPIILLGLILYFAMLSSVRFDLFVIISILVLSAIVLVVGVSPLLTAHEVGRNQLIIRQGWYFTAAVPLRLIKHAEPVRGRNYGMGIRHVKRQNRLFILTSDRRLVSVTLREEILVRALGIRRIVGEIILNVNDPLRFVDAINSRTEDDYDSLQYREKVGVSRMQQED